MQNFSKFFERTYLGKKDKDLFVSRMQFALQRGNYFFFIEFEVSNEMLRIITSQIIGENWCERLCSLFEITFIVSRTKKTLLLHDYDEQLFLLSGI